MLHYFFYNYCCYFGTVNRRLPRQDYDDELQPAVGVLQVSEHGLHAVGSLSIFAETRLALYWHPGILGDLPQLVSKGPERDE